ncbi:MAG: CinA family protein [Pseudonocardiales bacterium]
MTSDVVATVALIQRALLARGESVAVAESLTGGLVSATLTEPPGSSATFRGGLVVYAVDLKKSVAGVSAELLAEHGPVHEEVALALARGACQVCDADWGLGTTGAAGPESHGGRPGGTLCAAVVRRGGAGLARTTHLGGDRTAVRSASVGVVLAMLAEQLTEWVLPGEARP